MTRPRPSSISHKRKVVPTFARPMPIFIRAAGTTGKTLANDAARKSPLIPTFIHPVSRQPVLFQPLIDVCGTGVSPVFFSIESPRRGITGETPVPHFITRLAEYQVYKSCPADVGSTKSKLQNPPRACIHASPATRAIRMIERRRTAHKSNPPSPESPSGNVAYIARTAFCQPLLD